jgi:hypothetical protein
MFMERGAAEWGRLTPPVEMPQDSLLLWWQARWIESWRTYWAPLGMLRWLVFRSWRG